MTSQTATASNIFPAYAATAEIIREDDTARYMEGWVTLEDGTCIRLRGDGTGTDEQGRDWTLVSQGMGEMDEDGGFDEYETLGWTLTR